MKKFLLLLISHGVVGLAGFAAGIYFLPILTAPPAPAASEVRAAAGEAEVGERDAPGDDGGALVGDAVVVGGGEAEELREDTRDEQRDVGAVGAVEHERLQRLRREEPPERPVLERCAAGEGEKLQRLTRRHRLERGRGERGAARGWLSPSR